ncbi:MAG: hypothetical protein RRA35_05485 [Desulfomonilia bacterium]|nr:hypothetical protein [Desulfomonilia bacterium]
MMEIIDFFRQNPFLFGLFLGLLAALGVLIKAAFTKRALNTEIRKLKESLYTKMQIDAKGHQSRESELEQLRTANENLRITVKSLQQKPGRAEIRQLHVYDKAIHTMLARAPGFAPTWEIVLKEAEDELEKSEKGITAFMRRVFMPSKPMTLPESQTKFIDYEPDEEARDKD